MSQVQSPVSKPNLFRRILERYRWMSLWNKLALWAFVVVAISLGVSYRWIQPAYRTAKMYFFLNMAEKAVEEKNYNAAGIAYRKALLSGYEKPASWLSLAKFLNEVNSPEIINVWAKLSALDPGNREYRYNQARDALRFDRPYEAEEALSRVPSQWQDDAEFLRLQAKLFVQKKYFADAEKILKRLVTMDPKDEKAMFDLLNVQSQMGDAGGEAREKLMETAEGNSALASAALRAAITYETARGNFYEADRLAGRLILRPDATVQDRLLHADLELKTQSFSLAVTQANLRTYAEAHPEHLPAILQSLVSSQVDLPAVGRWIASFSPKLAAMPEAQTAIFQYYLAVGDWERMIETLRDTQSVVYLPPKVLDPALKAIDEDRNGMTSAEQTWMQAIYAAEGKAPALRILGLMASARGWTSATGRALSALANASPGDPSVWVLLIQHENAVRNLPGLYSALQGLMQLNPYDVNVASNWVLAAAMVRPGNLDEVLDVAKRTYYSTYPSDPRAATAYAMAFLRLGQVKEANEIIERMTLADRREPQRAIYVGSVLAANGKKEEALEYFRRSENLVEAPFPEEITLRRIWKGVAQGEATTAEEAAQILLKRPDAETLAQAGKINDQLREEMRRRSNPEEAQRILQSLQQETQGRKGTPAEVENLIRQLRQEQKP